MKEHRLLKALGHVDKEYVEEASFDQQSKKPSWLKWSIIAACLCLVAITAMNVLPQTEDEGEGGRHTI